MTHDTDNRHADAVAAILTGTSTSTITPPRQGSSDAWNTVAYLESLVAGDVGDMWIDTDTQPED